MENHLCPDCKQEVKPVWRSERGFGFSCACKAIWQGRVTGENWTVTPAVK